MADILATVNRLRAALLRQDAEASRAMVAAYRTAIAALEADLLALTERIGEAVAAGEETSLSWLYRQDRYQRLIAQAEQAMARYTVQGGTIVTQAQQVAVRQAQIDAAQLVLTAMGPPPEVGVGISFTRLPEEALTELVGTLQPGSPLRMLLDDFGADVSAAVRNELIAGLAAGHGPNQIAVGVRRAMGGEAWKARRLVRNEVLRSYRSAALASYRQNDRYVRAWRWLSARDRRVCAACWAMSGRTFPLTTPFSGHVQCRCVAIPVTVSWRDLGFDVPEDLPVFESGETVFARQSTAFQETVLGPEKYALYESGAIELRDTVRTTKSARWGTSRTVASTDEALANAEARRRRAA